MCKKMSSVVKDRDVCENILRETALIMLEAEERDKNLGNREAWEYISTYLCGENDRKSCCHFLRGETQALAKLGTFQIRVGKQGSKELFSLLCNIEPNAGEEKLDNPGSKVFDSGIVPQMERFHGPVEKGYTFLQSFKTQTGSFSEDKRMQIFAGLLEGEALLVSWNCV